MRLRPCIDIHNGKVKQIVGGTLTDAGDAAAENFVADYDARHFAKLYEADGLAGGHIILLNARTSPYYGATLQQALEALKSCPGRWQAGGGVTDENAGVFLEAGASHVIATSFIFEDGRIRRDRLEKLCKVTGPDRLVLDVSCRSRGGAYYVVTDRWQTFTDTRFTKALLEELAPYCAEFLVHAVDVEGRQSGPDPHVVSALGAFTGRPVTYAGGIHTFGDLELIREHGGGHVDVTIGSALDLFGGKLPYREVLTWLEGA